MILYSWYHTDAHTHPSWSQEDQYKVKKVGNDSFGADSVVIRWVSETVYDSFEILFTHFVIVYEIYKIATDKIYSSDLKYNLKYIFNLNVSGDIKNI